MFFFHQFTSTIFRQTPGAQTQGSVCETLQTSFYLFDLIFFQSELVLSGWELTSGGAEHKRAVNQTEADVFSLFFASLHFNRGPWRPPRTSLTTVAPVSQNEEEPPRLTVPGGLNLTLRVVVDDGRQRCVYILREPRRDKHSGAERALLRFDSALIQGEYLFGHVELRISTLKRREAVSIEKSTWWHKQLWGEFITGPRWLLMTYFGCFPWQSSNRGERERERWLESIRVESKIWRDYYCCPGLSAPPVIAG